MTPSTAAHQASLSITNSWSLPKLMSIESVMPSNHLILCRPFSSWLLSFPSSMSFPGSQLFASGGQSIGSFSFNISPSNSGLTSFRIDWLDTCSPRDSRVFSNTTMKHLNSTANTQSDTMRSQSIWQSHVAMEHFPHGWYN